MKEKSDAVREWMKNHNIPSVIIFFIVGIMSTDWFLIRVIPKPSRATYPCMRVAAPFMSGFVVYLLTGPDDSPNQPFGRALGINPGRVVWSWNPDATNENWINTFDL